MPLVPRYTFVRQLGKGGFGVVEEVKDNRDKHFARKTFRPAPHIPREAHDGLKTRFKREVKIQRELGGTEVIPVLATGLDDPSPWFVMPLADRSYDVQIEEEKASGKVSIEPIADILNGLIYLHDMGYVHRDLNPKNVLLQGGHWKLSDLGAILPPMGHTVTLTVDTLIYTERYCSPEQRQNFHKAQPAADIYSFGCILHDIFGTATRTPYGRHTAPGAMGPVIEKCTEPNPARRPKVRVLHDLVLDALVEAGGHCKVEDKQAEGWLARLDSIKGWKEQDYQEFAVFFAELDIEERTRGHERDWVYSLSTPFLTRIPSEAIARIVSRHDGVSEAIVEKYCQWAKTTAFSFGFADTVCSRLVAIFDHGAITVRPMALVALIELGESHNRWYVMREMLRRCSKAETSRETAQRLAIEIKIESKESQFRRCVEEVKWDVNLLAPEIRKFCS
jgi:serine/threonine protein kinase